MHTYYAQQGPFTDPGPYASLYAALPHDLDSLCGVVNGLVVHDLWQAMGFLQVPEQRAKEAEMRSVQDKLKTIIERDDRPLTEPRPFEERLIGNCRDQALLLCSFLRHWGIPARVRKGFQANAGPQKLDHAVCQVWCGDRWILVDVQMDNMVREADRLPAEARQYLSTLTPQNTPPEAFITGGQAWQRCRAGEDDPMQYGINGDQWGLWMVRHNLLRDLLALNKYELIPWDEIPNSLVTKDRSEPTPEQAAFLDQIAQATIDVDSDITQVQRLYQNTPALHVPAAWVP